MASDAVDIALAVTLVWVAWGVLFTRQLFRSAVLFIVFGAVSAIMWLRLGAPDLALAEAAIGSGLMGGIVLDAVIRTRGPQEQDGVDRG